MIARYEADLMMSIVIDDGSSDRTGKIVEDISK